MKREIVEAAQAALDDVGVGGIPDVELAAEHIARAVLAAAGRMTDDPTGAARTAEERALDAALDSVPDERLLAHKLVKHDERLGTRALGAEEIRGILRHMLVPGSTLRRQRCGRPECALGCAGDCYE